MSQLPKLLVVLFLFFVASSKAQVTSVKTGLAGNSLIFTSPDHTGDILYFKSSTKTGTNGANSVFSVTIGRFSLVTNTEVATITLTGLESTSSTSYSLQYNNLATDMSGNIYVSSNSVNAIKRFDGPFVSTGSQTLNPTYTYTLGSQTPNNACPVLMDSDGNLLTFCRGVLYRVNKADLTSNTSATALFTASTQNPYDIDLYTNGNILLSSSSNTIAEYTLTGTLVRNITLSGNAFSTEVASNGNIYYTSGNNNTIGVWSPCTGTASVIAGSAGVAGNALDAGTSIPYTNARFSRVTNICLRSNGDLLAADEINSTIYKIINPTTILFNYNPVKTAPGNALSFNGTNNYGRINNSVANNFTIEYWIRTTQTGSTGSQWYNGNKIVDADVLGSSLNDFGTSLNGSKLSFGVGNPDVTVTSASNINTGQWVHVAVTRNASTGTIQLFINGSLEASATGSTNPLTASSFIYLGADANGANLFSGSIDELRIYDAVLTQANIQSDMKTYGISVPCNLLNYYFFDNGIAGSDNSGISTVRNIGNNYNPATLFNFTLSGSSSNFIESYAMVAPTSLTASSITASGFTASWTAPAVGVITNYLLDVATDSLFTSPVSGYNALVVTATSQAITGLNGGTKYFFRVRADKTSVAGQGAAFAVSSATTLIATPVINTQPVNSSICPSAATKFFVKATSTLTLSYKWQVDNGTGFVNISDAGFYTGSSTDTLFVKNVDQTINGFKYRCVVTNTSGLTNSNAATLTVFSAPIVAPITGTTSVCVNATTALSSTTTGGVWASTNATLATVNTTGVVTGVAAGSTTISYTVTNANSCSTQVTSPITVNALPLLTPITGPSSVCQSKSISLNNSTTGGVWNSANTAIATVSSSGVVTGITAGNAVINYVVTNANNCSVINTTTVTVLSQPAKTPIVKDTLICKATSLSVDATVPSSATYAWTASTGGFTSSSPIVNISTPAMYRVTITLSNGCFYLDSVNLRNTTDTAIKAKMLLTSQAYLNENVVAVNITNPTPQTALWTVPSGAQVVSQTTSNLVLKFGTTGKYQVGLNTTSYNVCSSKDSGVVIISIKDTTITSTNTVVIREVNVSPNPSTGVFNFAIKLNKQGKVSLKIYSISGVLVYNTVIPEATGVTTINQRVDITSSPKDTYVAVIQTADAYEVRTLIKN